MTVLIDDANWGCLLRGCLVAAYRVETIEILVGEVPVDYFQTPKFQRRDYLTAVLEVTQNLLKELKANPQEPIQICSGWVLREVREWLRDQGYNWRTVKITGDFQEKLESRAINYVNELGVGIDVSQLEQYGNLFFVCLAWLKGGDLNAFALPEREINAKTGWKSYPIWAYNDLEMAKALARQLRSEEARERRSLYA